MSLPLGYGALSDDARLTSACENRQPYKTKIDREVAHVTRDSETSFYVKRSKVNLQGARAYCGGLPRSLLKVVRRNLKQLKH